jgi:hypothetical protein
MNLFVCIFQLVAFALLFRPIAGATTTSTKSGNLRTPAGEGDENTERVADQTTCVIELTLYEDLDDEPPYNAALKQAVWVDKPMYTDPEMTTTTATSDGICNVIDECRLLCNVVTTHEDLGITTVTGILDFCDGTGTFIFTGGTDEFAGIKGKITSVYTDDTFEHTVCIQ